MLVLLVLMHLEMCSLLMLGIMAGMDQKDSVIVCRYGSGICMAGLAGIMFHSRCFPFGCCQAPDALASWPV